MKTYQLISISPLKRVKFHPDPSRGFPEKLTLPEGRLPPSIDSEYKYVEIIPIPSFESSTHRIIKTLTELEDGWDIIALTEAELEAKKPPVFVADSITIKAWQAKAAITQMGLLSNTEAAIVAMPEGIEKIVTQSAWNNNADFVRNSPTIAAIGGVLGLTDEQIDELFDIASSLVV